MSASDTDPTPAPLRLFLFGPLEIWINDRPLPRLRCRKSQWLLALLALRQGAEVERDWLIGLLWPERMDRQALRNSLSELRRALGPAAVRLRSPTFRTLALDLTGATVDLVAFDTAIARGDPPSLAEAVSLCRGPLLEGCTEAWVFQERQARELAYLTARERLASHAVAAGDAAAAEEHLRRAAAIDPLRESTQRALMQTLAASGNYANALLTYRELRLRLHRELNTEPDPETQALFHKLRAEAREKVATTSISVTDPLAGLLPPGAVRDIVRDASLAPLEPTNGRQEHDAAPGPFTLQQFRGNGSGLLEPDLPEAGSFPQNLPLQLTSFVGRQTETAEVQQQLAAHRLVTLTGAGGCGKTRLALEVAARSLGAHPDGVWFVELAPLADPALVPQAVAAALGIRERPDRTVTQALVEALRPKQILLMLDNCEHLVKASAHLAEALLRSCPHLRILATSREPLGCAGEWTYRVPSLSLPPVRSVECPIVLVRSRRSPSRTLHLAPNTLLQYEATCLFIERAVTAQPGFALTTETAAPVVRICQRLDGIPLALELAAARLKALPVEALARRLDDMFGLLTGGRRTALPRHQTLRALIDWSYDLLTPPEQALLRRLSVFAGGWTLEAAEAICGDCGLRIADCGLGDKDTLGSIPPGSSWSDNPQSAIRNPQSGRSAIRNEPVLDLLTRLVEKSMVLYEERAGEGRYRVLDMIREYAREQLAATGEAHTVGQRHARFSLALAETAEREMVQADPAPWLERLEREHDNLRIALSWSIESGELELGLRLGSALQEFWDRRGYLKEGRDQLLRLLAQPGAAFPTAARARALASAGWLTRLQHHREAARRLHEESLSIWRGLGDRAGIAAALVHLAWLAVDVWDADTARPLVEESLAIRRELGDQRGIADALHCLSWVARHEGDLAAARALAEESLVTWRALGDRARMVSALGSLAHMTFLSGDMDCARPLIEDSLAAARELENKLGIAWGITRLGFVAHWQEDYPAARALFEESLPLWRELDAKDGLTETLFHLAYTLQHQGDYAAAYAIFEEMMPIFREWGSRAPIALLGNAAGHLGRWEEAAAHCAESLSVRREITIGNRHVVAWGLIGMARVALARERPARTARLLGAGAALWAASSAPWWPNERADFDHMVSAVRAQLEEGEFAAAWAEGQTLPVEQIIAEALEEAPAG